MNKISGIFLLQRKDIKSKISVAAPLFFCMLIWLLACGDTMLEQKKQDFTTEDTQMEIGKDVEILYSDSAVVRVRITGAVMHYFNERDNPRQEFPQGVQVEFLSADLHVSSTLTAKTAVRRQEEGIVIARDSVVMLTDKQEKLETEELIWDEKTKKVRTEKFVKVTKPGGEVIYGYGLEAEQDFSYWKIIVPKGRIAVNQINENL
jgi:LPS export ABC transporter protein LptC